MKYLQTYEERGFSESSLSINEDEFLKLFRENCKKFSFDDMPIIKEHTYNAINTGYGHQGDNFKSYYMHWGKKYRHSAYSPNTYTLLINHLKAWRLFPSRNVICSTQRININPNPFRVIPYDNSKWGIVPG